MAIARLSRLSIMLRSRRTTQLFHGFRSCSNLTIRHLGRRLHLFRAKQKVAADGAGLQYQFRKVKRKIYSFNTCKYAPRGNGVAFIYR
ncbi:hypothetical protein EVAR_99460_1 [Eumeta japonica]|uniref:Uncharacterized protein n=1 Tax=Eumeta variegata TaxID=151549 RepID=A0A4C1Z4A7_EUMVA|nr:hypothetical protein EVAR_99460_1 [Eumeta japonica]